MSNMDLLRKRARESRMKVAGTGVKPNFGALKYKIRDFHFDLGKKVARGQNLEVYRPACLNNLYGRDNLCLKVFILSDKVWGHPRGVGVSNIVESSVVQNLMAIRGLAPRVYDIIKINGRVAQVTDFLTGPAGVVEIKDDRFKIDPVEITNPDNFIAGKLVDWQGSIFKDFNAYKQEVTERAQRGTLCRGAGDGAYQSSSYFDGLRDTAKRIKKYQFTGFAGKNVLDIGCNYGMMTREAYDLGAKRCVGLDWPKVIDITRELAILDGYFNIDFYGFDLKTVEWASIVALTGIAKFDIHLFLALENWIGWPGWVKNCSTLYYEGHGAHRDFRVEKY